MSEEEQQPASAELKSNVAKKKKKKRGSTFSNNFRRSNSSTSKKPYTTCLPTSFRDCSWLENTESNILLLDEKNREIKELRERKKEEASRTIELEMQAMREKGVQFMEYQSHSHQTLVPEEEKTPEPQTPTTTLPFKFVTQKELSSLDQINERFRNSYYHSLDRLTEDLQQLVLNTIEKRAFNPLAKIYLTNFLTKAVQIISSKRKEFLDKWVVYYNIKLANNQASNCIVGGGDATVWYKHFDENTKRQYFEVNDYKIKVPGKEAAPDQTAVLTPKQQLEHDRIKEIMKTNKSSKCDGTCCISAPQ